MLEYVKSIGRKLKKAGYIDILLGTSGGLVIIKQPDEITFYDIVVLIRKRTPKKKSNGYK